MNYNPDKSDKWVCPVNSDSTLVLHKVFQLWKVLETWGTCRCSAQIKRGSVVEESHNEWPDVLDRWVKRESRTSCWTLDALGLWCDGSWCRKTSEVVAARCAHGDTVVYPLADVELELEGDKVQVVPAVAEHLPVSVLLVQSVTQKS